MNKACIAKLGWKLKSGENDFWCEVMRVKYKRNGGNDDIVARAADSSLWKAIVKLWPKLDRCVFGPWVMGGV